MDLDRLIESNRYYFSAWVLLLLLLIFAVEVNREVRREQPQRAKVERVR
jgi:hypothetical protein